MKGLARRLELRGPTATKVQNMPIRSVLLIFQSRCPRSGLAARLAGLRSPEGIAHVTVADDGEANVAAWRTYTGWRYVPADRFLAECRTIQEIYRVQVPRKPNLWRVPRGSKKPGCVTMARQVLDAAGQPAPHVLTPHGLLQWCRRHGDPDDAIPVPDWHEPHEHRRACHRAGRVCFPD